MAQQCPPSMDMSDIQFKLQSKHKVFAENSKWRDHVNLLAVASKQGLVFVGNPNAPELNAFLLSDVIYAKSKGQPLHLRTTKLPNIPNTLACNADGSMLAINYTLLQGYGVLEIYQVPSFATSDIKTLYTIRLPDENVYALQLLWNPVLPTIIGVVLSNGTFALYTLKEGGAIEMRSIKNQQIQCGCWSPKGKQIVLGQPNGKLQQFKPDLAPVKSIICPPNIHPGPFDTIALHWLSTFQFAVCFLQHGDEATPTLYIVNAPKGGTPAYINYNDVCYSGSGPRKQQITFLHIAQWNLLLVTSANGVEIGLLGTKENTDQPEWVHYMLLDEARIEMPLTEASDETYPIGIAFDTSPIHELTVGEQKLPTMPVIHVLTTHGRLLCFNFLNLTANAVKICSPSPPINYAPAKFRALDEDSLTNLNSSRKEMEDIHNLSKASTEPPPSTPPSTFNTQSQSATNVNNQNTPVFGAAVNKPLFSAGWEQKPTQNLKFGATNSNDSTSNLLYKPPATTATLSTGPATFRTNQPTEVFKPLYTVSPEFAAPLAQQQQHAAMSQAPSEATAKQKTPTLNLNETNNVIQQMIIMQISAFDKELKQLGQKSKLTITDDPSIMKSYSQRLINLQEILEQANERDFEMDVQDLRHSLTESYEMLNECRSKLEVHKDPEKAFARYLSLYDCVSQRQLKSLQSYLTINNTIMHRLEEHIDAQWSYYQDLVRRNSKSQMRIPCLDGIYQQMTKLKYLITQQQTKLRYIKSVIKQNDLGMGGLSDERRKEGLQIIKSEAGIVSLADSIISMSIHNITDTKSNKLPEAKLNVIRNFTNQQGKVTIIKPQRPNRVELTSEVILETKQLIKRKESKGKETKSHTTAATKVKELKPEKAATTFKPMQSTKQTVELSVSKPVPPMTNFGNLQNTTPPFTQPKETIYTFPGQGATMPFSTLNLSSNNLFAKTAQAKSERPPEMPKQFTHTTANKSDGAIIAPNKTPFSKPNTDDNHTAATPRFSFTQKSDSAEDEKQSVYTFNAPSTVFAGFGQQSANVNANTFFNYGKKATEPSGNQSGNIPKSVSFSSTFSGFSDINSGTKTTTQNQSSSTTNSNLPKTTASTQPSFGTTTMPTTISNKQTENQPSISSAITTTTANAPANAKNTTETAPNKTSIEGVALSKDVMPSAQPTVSEITTQTQCDTDDKYLQSLNICKPTVKDTAKSKEGNVFSFNLNNENNIQRDIQPVSVATSTLLVSKANSSATTTTTAPSVSIFGKVNTTPTASFSPFNTISANVSPFETAASGGANVTTPAAFAPPTTSTTGAASAFSFSNATLFKQLPAFQNQTIANTSISNLSPIPSVAPTMTATSPVVAATASTISLATSASPFAPAIATTAPTTVAAVSAFTAAAPIIVSAVSTADSAATAPTVSSPESNVSTAAATAVSTSSVFSTVQSTTSPFFSSVMTSKASGDSIFTNISQATKPENPIQQTTINTPTFGSLSLTSPTASGGNIFGNTTAGFGATTGNIFSGNISTSPAAGGATSNTSTGSIFGASAPKTADNTSPSIFGNVTANNAENTAGSIFGNSAVKSTDSVNVFGSPTQTNAATSSGSIFGQNTAGQSSGSMFYSANTTPKSESTSNAASFSFVGSAFGCAPKTATSGGSIFGGNATTSETQQPQAFGLPSSGFGATATSPFSSFSQASSSVASTGFGSSAQQQAAAFSRPVFGAAPAFGSPPAFGAQPSFGGAPTFGSPKGFGSFASSPTASFGAAPPQNSNIFEALGSTDTGLSFGNLAQTTNAPSNPPKPMFGGSSFMNYRA